MPVVMPPNAYGGELIDWQKAWDDYIAWRDGNAQADQEITKQIIQHGGGLFDTWTQLAYQPPPTDIWGRLLWSIGVMGQLIISLFTFPAALGAFLLEEAVQTYGMGAYMLSTGKQWGLLDTYLKGQEAFIDGATIGAKSLAAVSPITGGAVILYMQGATASLDAFKARAQMEIYKQAETDEALRQQLLDNTKYGTITLASTPSQAEIWLDGVNTERLTSETFNKLERGVHTFEVRKYSVSREEWDILVFDIDVTPGYKKEIMARIPPGITSPDEDNPTPGYAQIRLSSNPSEAEIWINGENTALLTPETFKEVSPGSHILRLRAYSKRRDAWDEHEFMLTVEANKKYEYRVNIPAGTSTEEPPSGGTEEDENPQLPEFMKATVTCDYAIDGDTFVTTTGERIRVLGIDAPEMGQLYALEAKEKLHDLTAGKKVYLKIQVSVPLDAYGRTLAIPTVSQGNVAYLLLIDGLARVFIADDATYDPTYYYTAEDLAKERKVGIWTELP